MSTVTNSSSAAETEGNAGAAGAANANAGAAGPTAPVSGRRKLITRGLMALAALALVAWIGRTALHVYHYVETDNAYVVGHLHQVSAQVDGQVSAVLVEDNQVVKAGDALVQLDRQEFEIAAKKAEAGLARAQAAEKQTQAAVTQAMSGRVEALARVAAAEAQIAQTQSQLALAKLTQSRSEQLFANGNATTQVDVDNSRSAASVAQANVTAANANRDAAKAAVASMDAALAVSQAQVVAAATDVAAAEATLQDARRKLSYTTIAASAPGRVGAKNVETGNRVVSGQSLLAIAEPDVWVVANFKETQLPRMRVGQPVELSVDALDGVKLHGTVDSFSPASGAQFALLPPDNATGNFNKVVQRIPVKIRLDAESQKTAGELLRLGYSVVVNVRVR